MITHHPLHDIDLKKNTNLKLWKISNGGVNKTVNIGASYTITSAAPAVNDMYEFQFYADPTHNTIVIGFAKNSNRGIIDIYLNDVMIQQNYDLYAAAGAEVTLAITPITLLANNALKIIVVSKNASSSNYYSAVYRSILTRVT